MHHRIRTIDSIADSTTITDIGFRNRNPINLLNLCVPKAVNRCETAPTSSNSTTTREPM
jgi:hypothetical protein